MSEKKVSRELLDILVCPKCKGELEHDEKNQTLTCNECRLRYRIEEGVPVMLIEEAEEV